MSWIKADDEAVNLDLVEKLHIAELEEPISGREVEDFTHGIFASFPRSEDTCVFQGMEDTCKARLEAIVAKLPMVKL